jgi:2-polyprenyl-3-methyl-5-hydroxy-6-metoxy-1,4-benzoquinol methylase
MNKKVTIFNQLKEEIIASKNESELAYFNFHQQRFERVFDFAENKFQHQSLNILDIGSHYLHTSCLLSELGNQVHGMDVREFWEKDFVQQRAKKYQISPIIENNLSLLPSLKDTEEQYDLVLFTEILEHITFNPIALWESIYKVIKNGGYVYISTPNSFALPNFLRNLKNLLLFKSIGITVPDILDKVTYGHHWKEFSTSEIKAYFSSLSEDFQIEINNYHYKNHPLRGPFLFYQLLAKLGNQTRFFAEELEIIIQVNKKKGFKKISPNYD